jgi:hypothetical protein
MIINLAQYRTSNTSQLRPKDFSDKEKSTRSQKPQEQGIKPKSIMSLDT